MSLDDLQAQLRGTLDQQFAALNKKYEDGIADARRQAAADAEREFSVRLEAARVEWGSQLEASIAAARAEGQTRAAEALEHQRTEHAQGVERERAEFAQHIERQQAEHAQTVEHERVEFAQQIERQRAEHADSVEHAVTQAVAAARTDAQQQAFEALERERVEHDQAMTQAVAGARRTAELELESERRRGQNEIEAARQQAKTEAAAARQQTQGVSDADRRQLTSALEAERQRAQADMEGLRQRMQAETDALRQRMQAEIATARQVGAASVKPVAPPAPAVPALPAGAFNRALEAIREIDDSQTLSQALDSLLAHAGAVAGRGAMFLINADRLKAWKASGIPDIDVQTVESSIGGKDLLGRAIQTGQATPSSAALPAPPFARLPADRVGLAVPLMIGGRAVAVLYADSGAAAPPVGWAQIVEALVRHTAAVVALRTAMRTLDMLGGGADESGDASAGQVDDVQGARRYARLLVSEIKLYNEAAVRTGRQQRDLLQRLGPEIDRAQRLYDERVPSAVGARHVYFQQELVQTLADGDPALLGTT